MASPASSPPPAAVEVLTLARAPSTEGPIAIGTCDAPGGPIRFGLAHLDDLHARYADLIGGKSRYAYIAGQLRALKAAQPTLVLDAGDDYERGALADLRSLGETTRQLVQALPIDARTFGESDFAYGEAAVLRDLRLSKHPVLAANVKQANAARSPFKSFVRFDVGCAKVGVIGLVTKNVGADEKPTDAPYDGVFFQDDRYSAVLEREAKAHRAEVDVLVALTHLGFYEDVALAHKGGRTVDLVVGGHSEEPLHEPHAIVHLPDKSKTYIVQGGRFGDAFGRMEVVVKDHKVTVEKYKVVDIEASLPVADDVADLAHRLEAAVVPDAHAVIAHTADAVKPGHAFSEIVWRAVRDAWQADALVVGKDVGTGLPKGELTLQRLHEAALGVRVPAGTNGLGSIWMQELTGDELAALARTFRGGTAYEWFGTSKPEPKKTYRVAFEKRAALQPKPLFGNAAALVHAAFKGEVIDALEAYARGRQAKGQALDE